MLGWFDPFPWTKTIAVAVHVPFVGDALGKLSETEALPLLWVIL